MGFSKIDIIGLRGFSDNQTLNFGQPNGREGSGLTVIVGPNNSGKSTIYEAFRAYYHKIIHQVLLKEDVIKLPGIKLKLQLLKVTQPL
ncbi:AAA family ATPase [Marivirga sp.]|uniref:AAA family ATPase n=1 Tax=Marivirga sp. TaxID=2018662 RepID=UPI0025F28C2F|nr:AAA family ATPase [Marivirga sp.]